MPSIPDNLIFINACPHDPYFIWQQEVFLTNLRKFNISNKAQVLVWYPNNSPYLSRWNDIVKKYSEVSFFFYKDRGVNLGLYVSQLRPHILSEHFRIYKKEFKDKVFFYTDSDIIFNYLPDFEKLLEDNINWQSDCSSYLDYNYLSRKEKEGNIPENEAIQILANIGKIPLEVIQSYTAKTGGAQCILKGVDSQFWEDVERQCIDIRKAFWFNSPNSINKKYFPDENKGFQSWCADMWALNMALWNRGKITGVTELLDFSWATNDYQTFLRKPIYHNAGATKAQPELFYKGDWLHKSPIGQKITTKAGSASEQYIKAIQEVI